MNDDIDIDAEQEPTEEGGEQESYFPADVPPNYINPPTGSAFANATWLPAGPEIKHLVERVLSFEEFSEVAMLDYEVVWRRVSHPVRNGEPIFASAYITEPRVLWQMHQREETDYPRFTVDLHWQHFENLRAGKREGEREGERPEGRPAEFVHEGILMRHIHAALMPLEVTNDILTGSRKPDVVGYAMTARRFGEYDSGIAFMRRQLSLFDEENASGAPLHYLAQD